MLRFMGSQRVGRPLTAPPPPGTALSAAAAGAVDGPVYIYTPHLLLEKEMAAHSSIFAWRSPGMAEPGGLPCTALHRVGQTEAT